jgi:hypothetical protein
MVKFFYRFKDSRIIYSHTVTSDSANQLIRWNRGHLDMFYCQGTFVPE